MRANYGPIMLINGIIASTSPGRYPHVEIDRFLLRLRQINVISLTAQHGVLIENYEIYNCEWNKHFFVSGAASLFFCCCGEVFFEQEDLNDQRAPSGCFPPSCLTLPLLGASYETLKVLSACWALEAQLTFGSRAFWQRNKDSREVALSSHLFLSTPFPWGLLERNELSPSYRETSSGILSVCASLCGLRRHVGQVFASSVRAS